MDIMKVPTVHRNFGTDGGLSKVVGGYSNPVAPSLDVQSSSAVTTGGKGGWSPPIISC